MKVRPCSRTIGTSFCQSSLWATAFRSTSTISTNEAFFEYGHAFRIENRWFKGLESSCQQHWFWYQGAHVLTVNTSQIVYLPHEWIWSLNVTGARTRFVGTPVDWTPSSWTKLAFPLQRRVTGNIFFAVGSEDFPQIDQVGRFSAHTFGGGLRYQFAAYLRGDLQWRSMKRVGISTNPVA
jgi:hypothetical protein